MKRLQKALFSVTAAASLGACASGSPEVAKPTTTTTETTTTTTAALPEVDLGKVAICDSLKHLNKELNIGTGPNPIAIFGDAKRKYGSVALLPDRTHKAIDQLETSISTSENTFRGDQIGMDSLGAIATSRLAADEVKVVLDKYETYQQTYGEMFDPDIAIDQSTGKGLVLQAREVTADALKNNCSS